MPPEKPGKNGNAPGDKDEKFTVSWALVVTVTCTMLGQVACGICGSALNSPKDFIIDFINETATSRGHDPPSDSTLTSLYALLSALVPLGSCVASVLTQTVADAIGRKMLLLVIAILGLGSAGLMGLSVEAKSPEMLFVGRALSGLMSGFASSLPPFYMAEILPHHLVGPVMVSNMLCLMFGVLGIGILSFGEILATRDLWPAITGAHGVVCVLQIFLLPFVVQSPLFLFAKNRENEGLKALQKLRGKTSQQVVMSEMKTMAAGGHKKAQMTVIQLLRAKSHWRPLLIVSSAFLSGFFTGIIIVAFYSVSVLESAGVSPRVARYMTPAFVVVGIAVSILLLFIVPRLKRRWMMMWGLSGMLVSEVVLTLALVYKDKADWLKILAIVCVFMIAMFHASGPAPLPFILLPELFEGEACGAASSIGVLTMNLSSFIMTCAFPPLQEWKGPLSILLFVATSTFFLLFFFFLQPETKGRLSKTEESYTVEGPEERVIVCG